MVQASERDIKELDSTATKISTMQVTDTVMDPTTATAAATKDDYKFLGKLNLPNLIVCVGFAASGKSTFSNALVSFYPDRFIRCNKDEMRGKGQFESALFDGLRKSRTLGESTVVVDQCNLTVEARRSLIEANHYERAWCIFFDIPIEECR